MKRTIVFAILFILVFTIAGAWWYFSIPTDTVETPQEPVAQDSLLTVLHSNVQIKTASDVQLQEVLQDNIQIPEGTYVKTSATGRAIIESTNSTTTVLDKNSECTIVSSVENKNTFYLALGGIWAQVQKVFGKGEYYQVQTANAVATVRGTSFGVLFTGSVTTVLVTEGWVALLSIDPITKQAIGQEVIVAAGQKGTVVNGKAPVVETTSRTDKNSEWFLFNNQTEAVIQPASPMQTPVPTTKESGTVAPVQQTPEKQTPIEQAPTEPTPTQAPQTYQSDPEPMSEPTSEPSDAYQLNVKYVPDTTYR